MTATTTSTTAAGYPLDTKEDPVLVPISIQARQALPVGNARPRHQDNGIIEDDMEISTVVPGQGLPRYEA